MMKTRTQLTAMAVLATAGVSTDERLQRLSALDLTNVRRKLMEPEPEGKAWTVDQTVEAEKWYKRYLASIIKFPDATRHVPNGPIDMFWHQHILDTAAYRNDCAHVLGYFLDHFPYYGLNGDADQRDNSFDETNELYRHMFGEDCRHMQHFSGKKNVGTECESNGQGGSACSSQCRDGDRAPKVSSGVDCHGENCSCGCANCGRDNRVPVTITGAQCEGSHCSSRDCNANPPDRATLNGASCDASCCGRGCDAQAASQRVTAGVDCQAVPSQVSVLPSLIRGVGCNSGGSGTGCGQGCGRGG